MNQYTIYCTKDQTKKAFFELGAPIEFELECPVNLDTFERSPYPDIKMGKDGEPILVTPTTEQMILWLESQEPIKEIHVYRYTRLSKRYWCYDIFDEKGYSLLTNEECFPNCGEGYSCRKEATLAAIDSALEYLINNKK